MNAKQLAKHGLDRRIGYKVKDDLANDVLFLRWTPYGWSDEKHGRSWNDAQAVHLLAIAADHLDTDVIAFQCCCRQCHGAWQKAVSAEFTAQTGDHISHGFAPECKDAELAAVRAQFAKEAA